MELEIDSTTEEMSWDNLTEEGKARYNHYLELFRSHGIDVEADPPPLGCIYVDYEHKVTEAEKKHALELSEKYGWV